MDRFSLRVPDMSCRHCVRAVSAAVSDVPGVSVVTVDVARKSIDVRGTASPAAVRDALAAIGYLPEPEPK
jgi:copper chaperone CopZ